MDESVDHSEKGKRKPCKESRKRARAGASSPASMNPSQGDEEESTVSSSSGARALRRSRPGSPQDLNIADAFASASAAASVPGEAAEAEREAKSWQEVKRVMNRLNSKRSRERQNCALKQLQADQQRLQRENEELRRENQQIRHLVKMVRSLQNQVPLGTKTSDSRSLDGGSPGGAPKGTSMKGAPRAVQPATLQDVSSHHSLSSMQHQQSHQFGFSASAQQRYAYDFQSVSTNNPAQRPSPPMQAQLQPANLIGNQQSINPTNGGTHQSPQNLTQPTVQQHGFQFPPGTQSFGGFQPQSQPQPHQMPPSNNSALAAQLASIQAAMLPQLQATVASGSAISVSPQVLIGLAIAAAASNSRNQIQPNAVQQPRQQQNTNQQPIQVQFQPQQLGQQVQFGQIQQQNMQPNFQNPSTQNVLQTNNLLSQLLMTALQQNVDNNQYQFSQSSQNVSSGSNNGEGDDNEPSQQEGV